MQSRISNAKLCYICGSTNCLAEHHVIFGTGKRQLAEEDGLKVNLCFTCHHRVHNDTKFKYPYASFNGTWQEFLKIIGQQAYEEQISDREHFIKRYGRSYLWSLLPIV